MQHKRTDKESLDGSLSSTNEQPDLFDLVGRLDDLRRELSLSGKNSLSSASLLLAEAQQRLRESAMVRESLSQRDALLRMATQMSRLGAWSVEIPSQKLSWSSEVREIYEVDPDFMPEVEDALRFYDDESRSRLQVAYEACLKHGIPYSLQLHLITAKGRPLWVHGSGEAVRDATGAVVRVQGAVQDISARKVAEQRERESSQRLAATMESIHDGFVTLDKEWRFVYINKEAERLFMRDRGELLGQVLWEEFPEIIGTVFEDEYRGALRNNHTREFEDFYPPFDMWLAARVHPSNEGLTVHFRDVTAKHKAGETLARSEERFRLLSKATSDAIWDWNLSTGVVWWNEGFESKFGYSLDDADASAATWSDHLHPGDRVRVLRKIEEVITGDANHWRNEYRFVRKDGSIAEVADRGYVLRDGAGKAVRMIGTMNDLTEVHRTAARLAEQAALLDLASDAILVFDIDGKLLLWYKGAETVYGWEAQEAIGRPVDQILSVDPEDFGHAQRQVLALDEWSGESVHQTKDGTALTVLARWTLVRDEQGAPTSILAIHTDVTERKNLEAQFLRAQRLESIGTLAGGLAHELNNLLAPILLASDLLRDFIVDEEGLLVLANVTTSAKRGADLIKRVLGVARGDDGERRTVDLQLAINEIGNVVRETFPRNITLTVDTGEEIWPVHADPTQLHQVLLNLCVNARDAMPSGGQLRLSLKNLVTEELVLGSDGVESPPGPYVCITVQDTGFGMPSEVSERVFEPFFTTKDVGAGTGLGLSTTLSIVRAHGGFIHLDSELNRGSSFKVYLPAQPQAVASAEKEAGTILQRGESELILLVDDEPSVHKMTKRVLERYGYRVLVAENGAEALSSYSENKAEIALVLTDLSMPIMDGPTMIAALRSLDPTLPIVGSSGLHSDANVTKASVAGMKHFVPKPYNIEMLLRTLKQALGRPIVKAEISQAPAPKSSSSPALAEATSQVVESEPPAEAAPQKGATVLVVDDLPEQATLAKRILQKAGFIVLTAHSGGEALLLLDNLEGAIDLLITDLRMPGMKGSDLAQNVGNRYPDVRVLFVTGGSLDVALPAGALLLGKPYSTDDLVESARQALA